MTILAFDLGGTAVKFGVLTTAGEILEKGKFKTPDNLDEMLQSLMDVKIIHSKELRLVVQVRLIMKPVSLAARVLSPTYIISLLNNYLKKNWDFLLRWKMTPTVQL